MTAQSAGAGDRRPVEVLPGVRLVPPASADAADTERRLALLSRAALLAGVSIPFFGLLAELFYLTPDLNDGAFHLGVTRNTLAAIGEGANPLDFWVPTWLCGFPLFHYYQPGAYLVLALGHLALPPIPLLLLYRSLTLVVLALFPAANYAALRWLGLPRETAGWGAFLSCLISARAAYGIEMESFTWSGWGLFTQAAALPILPLALAGGWRALEGGGRTLGCAALLAAAFLTHILYGYIAAVSLGLAPFVALRGAEFRRRVAGLLRFYAQSLALIAFFVVPFIVHLPYHAKSLYDEAVKFDSHGAVVVLTRLFSGTLLDSGRLPVMTGLALAGLYLCARRWLERRSPVHGWIGCGLVLWTLLYFGRASWGALIDLLPMSHGLHMERLSSGVHIFAIWLAAVALGSLSRWCLGFESRALRLGLAAGAGLLLIAPVLGERIAYLVRNAQMVSSAHDHFDREAAEFEPVLRLLRGQSGRVYAGHSGNWGRTYRVGRVSVYHLLSAEAIPQIANAPHSWAFTTDFQIQLQWPDQATYDLYDVRYLLTDQEGAPPRGAELLVHRGRHRLYRLPSEGPFSLVSVPVAAAGSRDTLWYLTMSWVKSSWSRERTHARLLLTGEQAGRLPVIRMEDAFHYVAPGAERSRHVFDPPGIFAEPPPRRAQGSLEDVFLSRHEAGAAAALDEAGVVLFKATYHPGWRAFVDGAAAPTMMLTPGLLGVEVPAGAHRLRLSYQTGWWKTALLLAGLALALAMDRWRLPAAG